MRLDELIANLATRALMNRAMGKSIEESFKMAAISSLAHQARKDIDGIPDSAVTAVENIATDFVEARNIYRAIETNHLVAQNPISAAEVQEESNNLLNPKVGITEVEMVNSAPDIASQLGKNYNRLTHLRNSVIKRVD